MFSYTICSRHGSVATYYKAWVERSFVSCSRAEGVAARPDREIQGRRTGNRLVRVGISSSNKLRVYTYSVKSTYVYSGPYESRTQT